VRADSAILAEGAILPVYTTHLALTTGGRVAAVEAAEGDLVTAGQVLLRVDDARLQAAVAQAEAALAAAQAELAKGEMGARTEEIAAVQAAVAAAQAGLAVARAQAPVAEAGVAAANAQIARAQAGLTDLQAGATAEEIAIANAAIKRAENQLWGAQAMRDSIGGAVDRGQARDADLDQAEAAVGSAYAALQIARLDLQRLEAGARPATEAELRAQVSAAVAGRTQAQAQVAVAEAGVHSAEAAVSQAQAQVALVQAGARAEDLQRLRAAVAQAEAALQAARAAADEAVLRAPVAATVVRVDAKAGEGVSPGVLLVTLADLSAWRVETNDLTELEVVKVAVGQQVTIVPDALPDLRLAGTVVAISDTFTQRLGDVVYVVKIRLDETDPRLRWGMTTQVRFE
jgi:HlyD family secretion protein